MGKKFDDEVQNDQTEQEVPVKGLMSAAKFFTLHENEYDKYIVSYMSEEHKDENRSEAEWLVLFESYVLIKRR
jgi:hypothetical protein